MYIQAYQLIQVFDQKLYHITIYVTITGQQADNNLLKLKPVSHIDNLTHDTTRIIYMETG